MLKNLTPHVISIHLPSGEVINLQPSGIVPRVVFTTNEVALHDEDLTIPVKLTTSRGKVVDLPSPEEGVSLIVSQIVAHSSPEREDLFFPGELIRDAEGRPIGCKGLAAVG